MTPTPPTTISRWTDADRTGDLAGMRACLAADARLISPLTDGFSFHGAEEVMAVFAAAFELLDDIVIHRLTGSDDDWVLCGTNRLGAQNLEEIQWLRLDEEGLIAEISLFIRPMPAAVMLLGASGRDWRREGRCGRRRAWRRGRRGRWGGSCGASRSSSCRDCADPIRWAA